MNLPNALVVSDVSIRVLTFPRIVLMVDGLEFWDGTCDVSVNGRRHNFRWILISRTGGAGVLVVRLRDIWNESCIVCLLSFASSSLNFCAAIC